MSGPGCAGRHQAGLWGSDGGPLGWGSGSPSPWAPLGREEEQEHGEEQELSSGSSWCRTHTGLGRGEEEASPFPGGLRARGKWQGSDRGGGSVEGRFEQPSRTQLLLGSQTQHCSLPSPAPEANAVWPSAWPYFHCPVCNITMGYREKPIYLVQILRILAENQSQIKAFQEILLRFACEHCNCPHPG